MEKVYCGECYKIIEANEINCEACGSNKKIIEINFEENGIEIFDQLSGKVKEYGIKKPIEEFKIGYDLHRDSGKWNYLERTILRKENPQESTYKEIITDRETGNIIRRCEEPLIDHINRGSAKKR